MSEFVHLHVHTEYSLLDGACRINQLVERVKSLGQKSVAITDHGVMNGVIDFYKACNKAGIKPIIGCEVYVAPRSRFDKVNKLDSSPYHLVLLCENNEGYENLIKLVSLGFTDGFYNKPRVDLSLLRQYSKGLIALSACLAGEIPRRLNEDNYEQAKQAVGRYLEIFGKENFFIELQDHGLQEQKYILPKLLKLSQETGAAVVATNDAHYNLAEDSKMQHVLLCIQTNKTVDEKGGLEFSTEEFYIKSQEEMSALFPAIPEAISNTAKIAERCNVSFTFGVTKLPRFVAPGGQKNQDYFYRLCYDGLHRYYGDKPAAEITERLEYELEIITRMGYIDYYLIVYDFIRFAREKGIPVGPGRGSGAGSLAAYCIGITGIDPIRYQLLFERFLNPERISMPDFDIDFCYVRRQEVIDYVIEKYGYDHVAQIVTFGTMAARAAIRDVGRALGIPYQTVDAVAKMIPSELSMTIGKALEVSSDLRSIYTNDSKIGELVDMAKKLEGMPRHSSTHAAGVVITDREVSSYVPLQKNDEAVVTQFPMTTLEELGLLKMDFLGLRTLTVISDAERMIQKNNPDFSSDSIPLDDKAVFDMLSQGQGAGVFQFESAGMRQVLSGLGPETIEDLIAVISLYRPGPMDSIPQYIENRHHPEKITYQHPLLEPILKVTYGCIVYQEQVMQVFRVLAGYSLGRADLVRRAMSKKKFDVMEKERKNFIYGITREDGTTECPGALKNGVSEKVANDIFNQMLSFASYAFNKSHAAAYAFVAYKTAYLKSHYPKEFMAALLTSVLENTDKVVEYISECEKLGIKVLPPSVNQSEEGFTVSGDNIRFGLLAVKNLGRGFLRDLIHQRKQGGEYTSLYNFCERLYGRELNKRIIESMIKCGALDCFAHNRRQMITGYQMILESIDNIKKRNINGQLNLFGNGDDSSQTDMADLDPCEEFADFELLKMEKETVGLFLSGHPLAQYRNLIDKLKCTTTRQMNTTDEQGNYQFEDGRQITVLGLITSKRLKVTKSENTMAFIRIEDMEGSIEALIFPQVLLKYDSLLFENNIAVFRGKISIREDDEPKLLCDSIFSADELQRNPTYYADKTIKKSMVKAHSVSKSKNQSGGKQYFYFKVPGKNSQEYAAALQLLNKHKGMSRVRVRFADTNEVMFLDNKKIAVDISDDLAVQMKNIVGNYVTVLDESQSDTNTTVVE